MNSSQQIASIQDCVLNAFSAFPGEFVAVWDETGKVLIHCNDAFSHFFGVEDKEKFKLNLTLFSYRKNELGTELEELIQNTINSNGHWTEEVMFRRENGSHFLGRLDITKFEHNEMVFIIQRIINIDTQRIFSENLFKEIKKFEALFQYATLPIILVDKQGSIILANQQAMDLFGYDSTLINTMKVEQLIPARFRDRHVAHRKGYDSHPENRPMGKGLQLLAVKKSGEEFPVEISLGHYTIDNEPYVIAFVIDITKRVEIENTLRTQKEEVEKVNKEIEELNAELEHKVEMRTHELSEALSKERELSDLKSRFVSMASHEFRTPLSTILSSVSLIGKYTGADEQDKRDKHILRIRSAVSNLTDILNEFLSLGKIEEGKIQIHLSEFNLKEQMQLIISEIHPILKSDQKINYEHNGHDHAILDVSLVRNIMINLISNAIKFSPEQSTIWVQSENNGNNIRISVKDEGLGIPEVDMKHLFERFFRGKNVVNIQGTGLGLHIVSRYIDLMGGKIDVQSQLEKGTEFTINFNI
jgi:PAS domain S-box-containing protein